VFKPQGFFYQWLMLKKAHLLDDFVVLIAWEVACPKHLAAQCEPQQRKQRSITNYSYQLYVRAPLCKSGAAAYLQ
jgi:hypothetical protein